LVEASLKSLPAHLPRCSSAPDGRVLIHETPTTTNGSLRITSDEPTAGVTYALSPAAGFGSVVWLDAKVKTPAAANKAQFLDLDGVLV
jgi:hypothetical protein